MSDDPDWTTASPGDILANFTALVDEIAASQSRPDAFLVPPGDVHDEVRRMLGRTPGESVIVGLADLADASVNVIDRQVQRTQGLTLPPVEAAASGSLVDFFREMADDPTPVVLMNRFAEITNSDGERMLLVMPERELTISPPIKMSWDFDASRVDFNPLNRFGGLDLGPRSRMLDVVSLPMPRAPGVDAMLADGWTWTGVRFERDQEPRWTWEGRVVVDIEEDSVVLGSVFVRTGPPGHRAIGAYRGDDANGDAVEVPGLQWFDIWSDGDLTRGELGKRVVAYPRSRYAGHIEGHRVESGRYADRLPTNRRRKREAAKARRRARLDR